MTMKSYSIGGTPYGFSARGIQDLGACEYTLVGIAVDDSSSVVPFSRDLEQCIEAAIQACHRSPRAENLMVRTLGFASELAELHGFRPLSECSPGSYQGTLGQGGMTALHDGVLNMVRSVDRYGQDLYKSNLDVNAILFVLTDGQENRSSSSAKEVKQAIDEALRIECLESIQTILVGVNTEASQGLSSYLRTFKEQVGFQQYIDLSRADARTLARLSHFVTMSISAQSLSLGTGQAARSLTL